MAVLDPSQAPAPDVSLAEIARMARMHLVRGKRLEQLCMIWQRTDPGIAAIVRAVVEETK
jgi:hypothetical protein